ncbi:MAG: tRNA guanosine(34) transglycosylase Tgt [Patescibacteria group bacterium]
MFIPQNKFSFQLEATSGRARAGMMTTTHGDVLTPVFMPVGTRASVKSLDSADLEKIKVPIILANTYHLYLRPGMKLLEQVGGVHRLMNWPRPILTDSGGFQVFSLAKSRGGPGIKIGDQGVKFHSYLDGSLHTFNPQVAIEAQRTIGADMMMAFDQCAEDKTDRKIHQQVIQRTQAWAEQAVEVWEKHGRLSVYGDYQALFGIVQGGQYLDLRTRAAAELMKLPFDGLAVGGETIGFNMEVSRRIMTAMDEVLPKDKPRYAMGLGRDPQDVIDAITAGFDMFDCVGPTRLARNGALFHGNLVVKQGRPTFASEFDKARLRIGSLCFAKDTSPIQTDCGCATCRAGYSRAYLHYLYGQKELSYYRLATIHNLWVMTNLTGQLRQSILTSKIKE